ncbi:ogr/Delta-like zinc finger family protein [Larsenimonas rhizosphaerae]|uniref:ogr/Delta-like zinc finger family protein n=1 Tax=Larsenimonas rhizosphaerae TaxID=2944682 RepID=UPI003D9C966E
MPMLSFDPLAVRFHPLPTFRFMPNHDTCAQCGRLLIQVGPEEMLPNNVFTSSIPATCPSLLCTGITHVLHEVMQKNGRMPRYRCHDCLGTMRVRTSKRLHPFYSVMYLECLTPGCGARVKLDLTINEQKLGSSTWIPAF